MSLNGFQGDRTQHPECVLTAISPGECVCVDGRVRCLVAIDDVVWAAGLTALIRASYHCDRSGCPGAHGADTSVRLRPYRQIDKELVWLLINGLNPKYFSWTDCFLIVFLSL